MKLYHGTVKSYLASILKEGLQPQKHVWEALWGTGEEIRDSEFPGVYLTPVKWVAESFAQTRTLYLATTPGEKFKLFRKEKFTKLKTAPVEHTEPVVLEVDLPLSSMIKKDPNCNFAGECVGIIYPKAIPPSCITVLS